MHNKQEFVEPITQYSAKITDDNKLSIKASGAFPLQGYSFQVQDSYFLGTMFVSVSVTIPEDIDDFVGPAFPEFNQTLDIPKGCRKIIVEAEDKENHIFEKRF